MKLAFRSNLYSSIKLKIGRLLRVREVTSHYSHVTSQGSSQVNLLRLETLHSPLRVESFSPKSLSQLLEDKMNEDMFDFVSRNMMSAVWLEYRERVWDFCIQELSDSKHGVILEFGVFEGNSINYFSSRLPDKEFIGFDSFLGLEESWKNVNVGYFNVNGRMPEVSPNVRLIEGWFEDSLPKFIDESKRALENLVMIHLDADTYKPTKTVLNLLNPYVKPGLIILFDEFMGYVGFQNHEFRAFLEYVEEYKIEFEWLAYNRGNGEQVAVRII